MKLEEYISLPYTKLIQRINDESGHYYCGRILELDGCQNTADTHKELINSLNENMEGYIEVRFEKELDIPITHYTDSYSRKFLVRLPKLSSQKDCYQSHKRRRKSKL